MVAVATLDDGDGLTGARSTLLLIMLGAGLLVRVLANQRASAEDHERVQEALTHRERALAEADAALERVREANEVLRRSEEHLRSVFEAAVDGFVELEADGTIERANETFCAMVRLDRSRVEGVAWEALAASLDGADEAFARLADGGSATLARPDGPPMHLEARASAVPTDPPRRLILIRDVSAGKVADQTIRSLFQFLQDRDEDRTRLLRRTNAAIEHERNRVARDLHDGPVQGVSAASLSLEASLLMIRSGDVEGGLKLLARIRVELAGEADALRRLMANLRPPVLEERGLMPAIRDTLARFGSETGVAFEFSGRLARSLPDDLETLAFRVVQEALQNVAKHAGATTVSVHVETDANQLRIEVEDDGRGFDTAEVREFLRTGRVGLASMRERVELASGTFAVRSNVGRGTAVMASVPLDTALVVAAN
jgi:two-component system sensor histidine kinase UhpB